MIHRGVHHDDALAGRIIPVDAGHRKRLWAMIGIQRQPGAVRGQTQAVGQRLAGNHCPLADGRADPGHTALRWKRRSVARQSPGLHTPIAAIGPRG